MIPNTHILLDFCPIVDMNAKSCFIDIPQRRRKVSKHKHSSFHPKHVADKYGSKENPSGIDRKISQSTLLNQKVFHLNWTTMSCLGQTSISILVSTTVKVLF